MSKELMEKRAKAIAAARALLETAGAENRDLSDTEQASYDAAMADFHKYDKKFKEADALAKAELEIGIAAAASAESRRTTPGGPVSPYASDEYVTAVLASLMRQPNQPLDAQAAATIRALSTGTDTEGGFLVMPEQWVSELLVAVKNIVFMRSKARVFPLNKAVSLGVPTLDTDLDDAEWTTELATGSEDNAMRFGKRALFPHPFAKRIKISNNLIENAAMPIQSIVNDRLAYKIGVTEEKGFMTGTGVNQPLGLFTASANGISTGRDVSTGNETTAPTFDGLIEAKFSLKTQYWNRADWIFHRDVLKSLVKIKDGDGQYIWRESVRAGEPDMLLGRPINLSEYSPNTMTTGKYVGILGDFGYYWIADALNVRIQILKELYAETNQTGIIARKETDGAPVLEEAFARVKLA